MANDHAQENTTTAPAQDPNAKPEEIIKPDSNIASIITRKHRNYATGPRSVSRRRH